VRILVAEDEELTRALLEETLSGWGYQVAAVGDGVQAWEQLRQPEAPPLALLDWEMPGLTGLQVCRNIRAVPTLQPPYLILVTARDSPEDLVEGLRGGANDYLTKPFYEPELAARLQVAQRTLELQGHLAQRVKELEDALAHVKQLRGLLPICAWCKKIRNDQNYWQRVEDYISQRTDASFTHGMCPECFAREIEKITQGGGEST
jgi:CheY-like chemotaxis protein